MNKRINSIVNSKVRFKIKELYPKFFHLEFESQKDLTSTLIRFQEHYESPKFRGKIFSLDEFVSWYKTIKKGKFTYFTDWSGFNFPSTVLNPFQCGDFGQLTVREKTILRRLPKSGKFYVVATHRNKNQSKDILVMRHELAHALFYLNPRYRKAALKILNKVKLKPIFKYLKSMGGYCSEVLLDEAHAYLMVDSLDLRDEGIKLKPYKKAIKKLNRLFDATLG